MKFLPVVPFLLFIRPSAMVGCSSATAPSPLQLLRVDRAPRGLLSLFPYFSSLPALFWPLPILPNTETLTMARRRVAVDSSRH